MIKNPESLVKDIVAEIQHRMDIAVVGMSGGIDSSVVTTLCAKALGPLNVIGVHMPYSERDSNTFNRRSEELAAHLGVVSVRIPITDISDAITVAVGFSGGFPVSKLHAGNARSRSRMCVLYGVSGSLHETRPGKRVRVVGTGNLSEDFIGYDTKGGDALADLFPIGELFKSEVYQLAEYLGIPDALIDRVPSAGLWYGQTDEAELGHTYNEMEPVIKASLNTWNPPPSGTALEAFVLNRHMANKHKHEAPPTIPLRGYCD